MNSQRHRRGLTGASAKDLSVCQSRFVFHVQAGIHPPLGSYGWGNVTQFHISLLVSCFEMERHCAFPPTHIATRSGP
jgi:hypothetical protein